ncbi:pyridoxamine 5'-phosphate oxidase family protein [Ruminococcus flavefaciens]|uniref:pyridoxamine 5'-phosphate oxidase family protein n=1 Tax=Ruminococcus flavefaciens TaxID=1265 RepID=UPI0015653729|nr:pyridoxamine 5'-phosphate oxidase family protein [Ruminococcus flavefaciens]
MTQGEIRSLIDRSLFASLGYTDESGRQNIRRVFCVWHKGLGTHLISTNTSSSHVQSLMKNGNACLYFSDDDSFEAVCLYGKAKVSRDRKHKELLWNEGDEKYYPKGIDDEDYSVIVFTADSGRYYRSDGKADLTSDEISSFDSSCTLENGYSKTHR